MSRWQQLLEELSELNTLKPRKTTISSKGFKGTVVNRTLSSLHGGSLDIMLTALVTEEQN